MLTVVCPRWHRRPFWRIEVTRYDRANPRFTAAAGSTLSQSMAASKSDCLDWSTRLGRPPDTQKGEAVTDPTGSVIASGTTATVIDGLNVGRYARSGGSVAHRPKHQQMWKAEMIMKPVHTLTAAVVAAAAAAGTVTAIVVHQRNADTPPAVTLPTGAPVNPSAAGARLLQDAADIAAYHKTGEPNFSYVPEQQPPDLLRMGLGGHGAQTADTYQFGDRKLQAIVVFSADSSTNCPALCVRGTTPVPAATAGFRHVMVYFTGNVGESPSTTDPATAAAAKFWSSTTFVPVAKAAWFTELLDRAARNPQS